MPLSKESNEQLGEELSELRTKYDDLFEGKGFMRLLAALAKKQNAIAETFKEMTGKRFDIVLPR